MAPVLRDPSGTSYFEAGTGSPVVLLHGVGLGAAMWRPVVERMAVRHRMIVPDMLGHGASPLPGADATLADYARQIVALLRHLDVEHAGIAGFSMGAMVAQRLAIDHAPSVARLALVCAVHDRSLEARLAVRTRALQTAIHGITPSVPTALERWFTPSFATRRPDVIDAVRATLLANDPTGYLRSYALFAQADEGLAADAPRIRAPTLIVAAEHDTGSTTQMARSLHECIAGSRLVVVPAVRHMLPLEEPERLAQTLTAFFEG
ncbi:MAG: alpha/beta fold hydrolase [Burkholderiales bacterium]|nr:alpha/beta fold hydrolase [Burkholderiales bacterium]